MNKTVIVALRIRVRVCVRVPAPTHDLSEQNHILPPHDEDSSRDVSKLLPHVDPLDRLVENQVGWRTRGSRDVRNTAARLQELEG